MSTVTRHGLQVLTDRLGDALASLTSSLGNTDTKPGALLKLEAALCRLRGSTLYHDDDTTTTQKTVDQWCLFGSDDPVGLGLQGARIDTPLGSALAYGDFSASPTNPNAPVPCLEGWGYSKYHAWSLWPTAKRSDETLLEYNTRLAQGNPVKFVSGSPVIVPLFDRGRRIAIQKPSGFSGSRIKFSITRSQIEGVRHWLPASQDPTDVANASYGPVPLDIRFYCFGTYSLGFDGLTWTVTHGTAPSSGDAGTLLNHLIRASHTSADTWDVYIDIPSGINSSWANLDWWPIVMYVGTSDSTHSLLTVTPSSNSAIQANAIKVFEWNNYFRNEIVDRVDLDAIGSNGMFLVSRNKTHFSFVDGQFSNPDTPYKYLINSDWPAADYLGIPGASSLNGWVQDIQPGCAICVLLTTRNQGSTLPVAGYSSSTDAVAIPSVVVGPQVTPEFIPVNWSDSPYFPPLPDGHNLIAKVVLYRAPGPIYGLVEAVQSSKNTNLIYAVNGGDGLGNSWNIHANVSIAWMEQVVPTHAAPEIGDEELSLRLLRPLRNRVGVYRNILKDNGVLNAAYQSVVPASRVSLKVAQGRGNLVDPNSLASRVMHMNLKKPNDPLLKSSPNTPIQFTPYGNTLIYSLTGKTGSVDLLRLDSDRFYTTGNKLDTESELEIYLEPSDNCGINDRQGAGNRVGWDYTLRLELGTGTENTLLKDWYINASKYFLSDGEYNDKLNQGNSMVGYFKYGTPSEIASQSAGVLQTMNEFRLHGYAGVVPDLQQGNSVVLETRQVSPPDSSQITEEQFIQNLKNQGYNQAQIDEAISQFLDDGGVFYVVNTNHYSNLFTEIKSAGLCVSQFTVDDTYWIEDYHTRDYFTKLLAGDDPPPPPPAVETLRADAFTLASSGLSPSVLESWGSQANAVDSSVDISHPTYTQTDKILSGKAIAFKVSPQADCTINDVAISAKIIIAPGNSRTTLLNTTGQLNISLFSDSQDSNNPGPGAKIASLKPVLYSDLSTTYQYLEQVFNYKFLAGVQYWLVIEKSEDTKGGMISINSRTPTNIFVKSKDYNDNWIGDSLTAWMLLYDSGNTAHPSTDTNTGNWMQFNYGTTALRFTASASFTLAKIALHFKNSLYASNNSGSLTNASTEGIDVAIYTNNSGVPGTLIASGSRILYSDITSELSVLNSTISTALTSGTVYWIVLTKSEEPKGGVVFVDGLSPYSGDAYVSYDDVTFELDYGDEYIEFHVQPHTILGAFNRQTSNVDFFLPGPNKTRIVDPIYKLDGYWSYNIQKFSEPTTLAIYPRAVYDSGTSTWYYVRFANDVYGVARLLVGTNIVTVRFKFNAASADSDPAPSPIVLSDSNGPIHADGVVYLGVAKTLEELETPTNGAPPGDILVLRSV